MKKPGAFLAERQAGKRLSAVVMLFYGTAFLLKGGHADSAVMTDRLYLTDGNTHSFEARKIESTNLHGTGCALSSAIASQLALGHTLPEAVEAAKRFLTERIARATHLGIGHGNGPVQ